MGICQASNEGRIIRLTKKTIYQFNENKAKIKSIPENSKHYKQYKIKERKCRNYYNINNKYNYSISNNNDKDKNDEEINDLKLVNQPMQNLFKEKKLNEDIYQKLLTYFNSKVNIFPYNNISQNQVLLYENEYTENKIVSPYKFIESKNYGKLFNKIYELCFLKCEPLLNNINDDKKIINFLFFRSVIILLRDNILERTSEDIINSLIDFSYDNISKYINKDKFKIIIKSFCEICYQILFYFFIASNQFTEDQYYEYLSDSNFLMNDKYSNVDIDIFCLNLIYENENGDYKLEEIVNQWSDFICENINNEELNKDKLNDNNIKLFVLKNKIKEMINPFHLFEVIAGLKLQN